MTDFFWQLPGPRQFFKNIVMDLQEGHSLFLILPQTMPKNFLSQLRFQVTHALEMTWESFDISSLKESPLESFFKHFDPLGSQKGLRSIPNLYELNHFSSKLLYLENVSETSWPEWKKFLIEYLKVSQTKSLIARTLFIVNLPQRIALELLDEKEDLRVHHWNGVIDEIDMMLYVSSHIKARNLNPLYKKLAISIITYLSLWDSALADILLQESFDTLLQPFPILEHFAQKRGWDKISFRNRDLCWQEGILYTIESQEQLHSAFLAVHGPPQELHYRLWRSHLQVLFPYVEEQRQLLIPQISKFLSLPFQTASGVLIEDPLELELGPILQQLFLSTERPSPKIYKTLNGIKKIRDYLAHLEPVPPELILEL